MTSRMNAILERILSQEIARQEVWGREDVEMFGENMSREPIIAEIKQFMEENDIHFNQERYIQQVIELSNN